MSSDLIKQQSLPGIQPQDEAMNLLQAVLKAVGDPKCDVDKLKALLAVHNGLLRDQREQAFIQAKVRLSAKLPVFEKRSEGKNSKYTNLEDIHLTVKPLLEEEGFAFDFDEEARTDKTVTFIGVLSHISGHKEVKRLTVHTDTAASSNSSGKPIRPAIQDDGSTVSYARRYLITMHLNLVFKDQDTDGEDPKLIDEDQIKTIDTLLADTKSNRDVFFKMIAGVEKLELIPARDYRRIINSLQIKLREMNAKSL